MNVVGVLHGTGATSAKESGAIITGMNARAMRIATDQEITIGSGVIEAMGDPVKVLILRVGRRCNTKVGINIIIISS